jgi:hypothetical protein
LPALIKKQPEIFPEMLPYQLMGRTASIQAVIFFKQARTGRNRKPENFRFSEGSDCFVRLVLLNRMIVNKNT